MGHTLKFRLFEPHQLFYIQDLTTQYLSKKYTDL